MFPDSSAVELSTVNRAAVGSNPTRGATSFRHKKRSGQASARPLRRSAFMSQGTTPQRHQQQLCGNGSRGLFGLSQRGTGASRLSMRKYWIGTPAISKSRRPIGKPCLTAGHNRLDDSRSASNQNRTAPVSPCKARSPSAPYPACRTGTSADLQFPGFFRACSTSQLRCAALREGQCRCR